MRKIIFLFLLSVVAYGASAQRYLFYLHGRIVEDQGANAKNEAFGAYEYDNILAAFRREHFNVISEVRKPNTDVKEYARKVVSQVDSLLKLGIKPGMITVVGASKGALIAMYVSTFLKNEHVNFVFMSSCSDYVFNSCSDIEFCGNILSIFEKSDEGNGTCVKFRNRTTLSVPHYKDVELNTRLQHGYLYKPLAVWVTPVVNWANEKYN